MTLANTGTLRRMCWVFPDRESTRATAMWHPFFWDLYAEVAADLGLSWTRHAPDAVTVDDVAPDGPRRHRPDASFAPPIPTPDDAPALDRLLAVLGRSPRWPDR